MKHFQIDPAAVIGHAEQIIPVAVLTDIATRKHRLLRHLWRFLSILFKIIPEHTGSKSYVKSVELRKDNVQSLLQRLPLHFFVQFHTDTVHIRHTLPRDRREEVCGIVKLIPPDLSRDWLYFMLFLTHSLFSHRNYSEPLEIRKTDASCLHVSSCFSYFKGTRIELPPHI